MQKYFDYVYNPVYDLTTARLNQYRKLHNSCIEKFDLHENDKILCVGLGTGNELVTMFRKKCNLNIVGVDYSKTAVRKAHKKAKKLGGNVEIFLQDAHNLKFETGSFDKALCIHVMDFADDDKKVTAEILRVLKGGGKFVITYPSDRENAQMGLKLFIDNIHTRMNSGKATAAVFLESSIQAIAGIVYLPLLFRSNRKAYKRNELENIFSQISGLDYSIEEDTLYQDHIVYGSKLMKEGIYNASRGRIF